MVKNDKIIDVNLFLDSDSKSQFTPAVDGLINK